ncbi:cyclic nucleotide-binding domain-containing protein [Elizabethkingia ursingii]|uniref:Crp/Fnr family transcriptional regulator n=1 Tax=Elizabethkingia ursingii TaxID=1756150 RepID=UPI002011FA64|nr:cyclic nucleotide-binding domain-containing protein [Elizabethkingia ursingii]MCL1667106.1 cyclic nucleotide-binding domain-containing protein [Elizabethkingia ursingii]
MDKNQYFQKLADKLPEDGKNEFVTKLSDKCDVHVLNKNESLIAFQSNNRKIYFIAEGSFVRNIITSKGEEKTVMFHTDSFCEFFKSYDTIYFHQKTAYEIIANEKSVVLAVDYDFLMQEMQNNIKFLQFYIHKTEELFLAIDLFRNFQLGLTSEEYLKWLYENYSFLLQRFPAQNIASFMGITNVWLSNLKSKITF